MWGTSHTSLSDKIAGNYEQCPLIMCITNLLKQLSIVKSNPNNGPPSLAVNFLWAPPPPDPPPDPLVPPDNHTMPPKSSHPLPSPPPRDK